MSVGHAYLAGHISVSSRAMRTGPRLASGKGPLSIPASGTVGVMWVLDRLMRPDRWFTPQDAQPTSGFRCPGANSVALEGALASSPCTEGESALGGHHRRGWIHRLFDFDPERD